MKLFMNNQLYVNKADIRFIMNHYYTIGAPGIIYDTIAGCADDKGMENLNGKVKFSNYEYSKDTDLDFVSFYDQNCIDFIMSQSYIINYDVYKDIPIEEMEEEISRYDYKVVEIADKYSSLSEEDKLLYQDLLLKKDMCKHAVKDLKNIIEFKQGKGRMILPEEYPQKEMRHRDFLNKMLYFTMDRYKDTKIY